MNTSYKRCNPSISSDSWDSWYKQNLKVTKELSILMNKPIEEVTDLLYNLTLQNYNNILNPRRSGWNTKRVPLSRLDVCDRYFNVFDFSGNLRDRRHPRSLILLLQFLQSIIDLNTESEASTSNSTGLGSQNTTSRLPVGGEAATNVNEKYEEFYNNNQEDKVYFMYSKRLGRLIDPEIDKIAVAMDKRITGNNGPRGLIHDQLDNLDNNRSVSIKGVVQRQDDYGNEKQRIRYRSAILSVGGPTLANDRTDNLLTDDKGRRRGHGSVQLMDLRSKRNEFLRHLLAKVNKSDPDRFLKSLGSIDLRGSRIKHAKVKSVAEELAKFYSNVVTDLPRSKSTMEKFKRSSRQQNRSKNKSVQRSTSTVIDENVDRLVLAPRERRYYGEAMPVLYHAPYKDSDRSTWLRRYPDQLRLQEDGQLGMSSVRRYKRDSVQKSIFRARQQYSIHSLNSQIIKFATQDDLHKKSEYKRIFPSASRRNKQSKH